DQLIAETMQRLAADTQVILALNKADLLNAENRDSLVDAYKALVPHHRAMLMSALHNEGVRDLIDILLELLPLGPRYFPADQVSEVNMRFIAAEVIREKIM